MIGGVSTGNVSEDGAELGSNLLAADGAGSNFFGTSTAVSADGNVIVVGALGADGTTAGSGKVYLYDSDGNQLTQLQADDGAESDRFGESTSISANGDTIVVGSPGDDDNGGASGSAYIFDANGDQIAKLTADDAAFNDAFGRSVDISSDGSIIVVGSPQDDDNGSASGSAYLFDSNGNQLVKLVADDASSSDFFGDSVALSGDGSTVVVGAFQARGNVNNSGSVYVFDISGNQLAELSADDGAVSDQFGDSISVSDDGNTIVIGARNDDDDGSASGSAYIFDKLGNQLGKITADDAQGSDRFGTAVNISADGSTIAIGAIGDRDQGPGSGSVYVFDTAGVLIAKLVDINGSAGDAFGRAVSLSDDGSTIVVGSPSSDELGDSSGSAFKFVRDADGNYVDAQGNIFGPTGIVGQAFAGETTTSGELTITDADDGEATFQEIAAGTAGDNGFGTFEVSADGNWTFILDNDSPAVQALGAGDTATDTITVTSFDGSATQVLEVTINGTNDGPTVAAAIGATIAEDDGTLSVDLLDGASDVDGDTLNVTDVMGLVDGITLNGTSLEVDPSDESFQSLGEGDTLDIGVTYTIEDGNGGSVSQTATVTIAGTNDAPVVETTLIEADQDTPLSGTLTASDIDDGDTVTFVAETIDTANGSVMISPDGSYTYTPDVGFTGIDTFTVTVEDDNGGTSTQDIRVEVENETATSPSGQDVEISIDTNAVNGNPFGNLSFELTSFDAPNINLVFGLDGSGSIDEEAWNTSLTAVSNTISTLAASLQSSPVQVDVHLFQFAGSFNTDTILTLDTDPNNDTPTDDGGNLFKFDLKTQSATIVQQLANFPKLIGSTPWSDAFKQTRKFLLEEPEGETNLFYFISDGDPFPTFNHPWENQLQKLNNQVDVEIQAFGVGTGYSERLMSQVDSDGEPTFVEDFGDLSGALSTSGLFPAELVDFSVKLVADGVDKGEIADETSGALVQDVAGFDLALADIEGLGDLLGSSNELAITGTVDFDGDLATTDDQAVLTSFALLEASDDALTSVGTSSNDLLLGGTKNDTISGAAGDDLILGYAGDDVIEGGEGDDTTFGGLGSDTFVFGANSGNDVIGDFEVGTDGLMLNDGLLIDSFAELDTNGDATLDTVVTFSDGATATLLDVDSILDSDDFLI